jgi:hypothetical protein
MAERACPRGVPLLTIVEAERWKLRRARMLFVLVWPTSLIVLVDDLATTNLSNL